MVSLHILRPYIIIQFVALNTKKHSLINNYGIGNEIFKIGASSIVSLNWLQLHGGCYGQYKPSYHKVSLLVVILHLLISPSN